MVLIKPPAIKYANSRFTIIKPPRNKVRKFFCFLFFSVFPFSIRFQLGNSIGNSLRDFYDSWMFGPNFFLMLLMFGGGVY